MKYLLLLSMLFVVSCVPKFRVDDVVSTKTIGTPGIVRSAVTHLFGLDDTYIVCWEYHDRAICEPYKGEELVKINMTREELETMWYRNL